MTMRLLAIGLGAISAFFLFYTVRLRLVTGFLQHTRAGGQGSYIGAIVFPLLALVSGWGSLKCWRRGGRGPAA
jgi:hypothetical protein